MTISDTLPLSPSPEQLWGQVLAQLELQMTRGTFDAWLRNTTLSSTEHDTWRVVVNNSFAKDWLENRLADTISRTVATVTGHPVEFEFVVKSEVDLPVAAPETPLPPQSDFARRIDFEKLWQKSGFTQIPDYAIRFWRAYLGRAFDLWELLVSEDKRDVKLMHKGELPYWTPPKRHTYHGLAAALRCSRKTLTGRLAPCPAFERLKREARFEILPDPPAVCCRHQAQTQWRANSNGEAECVYWLEGLLERLYREGLIAVQRVQTPGKPRAHDLRLQVWRLLPLLTPIQIDHFPRELDREQHRDWLERYAPRLEFDVGFWEQITQPSLVPDLPGYDWGRELHDVYLNNPLLAKTGEQ